MHVLQAGPGGQPLGTVVAAGVAPGCFAVQVEGDHLYPTVRHGACLLVEPDGDCVPGELVLIELAEGSFMVCELVAERADTVMLLPVQGGQRQALPRSQVAKMQPIASVVSASKFKPR